ncbi:MAG: DsbA family protein [Gracilibacteraceae bacterium]|jgi:predicted DsbA family dithiol-disulfide isomerase|nr:DsbA family protein [Gracilibacteraceae bacterium]
MAKLEVFFDYACPFCLQGHELLTELLRLYPDLEVEWRPCEAHPRPEQYGRHSDLCARAMYFALEQGADMDEYHRRMYRAALIDEADIEKVGAIQAATAGLLDQAGLADALGSGLYGDRLRENNRQAWEVCDFPAVPSFRLGGGLLPSKLGIGVSKEELAAFLESKTYTS